MKVAIVLAVLVAAAMAAPRHHAHVDAPEMTFEQFKAVFGKSYAAEEEAKREAVYNANLEFIRKHNADETQTYKVGVNEYVDLTSAEFKQIFLSRPMPARGERDEVVLDVSAPPASVDWRTQNAVTPVKNQGQCGSCWSFSTTGSVEGAVAIASKTLQAFSEQQLMDCSTAEGNQGCNGGLMDDAFQYIIKNGGIDTEADYPYTARDGTCNKAKEAKHAGAITGFKDVPKNSDAQFAAAVAIGPVSVAIEADQSGFQMYKSGVFSGPCGTQLDHGVLAVGYTADYWIVKNSWGATWGQQGYIMMSRKAGGPEGICGILSSASYPTGGSAPNPGPSPPSPPSPSPPSPPSPSSTHYGDPKQGCKSDETAIQITGVAGDFCSPSCGLLKKCPTDVPAGTTAQPECVLETQGSSSPSKCALICNPSGGDKCPTNASCKSISTVGVCTYDD